RRGRGGGGLPRSAAALAPAARRDAVRRARGPRDENRGTACVASRLRRRGAPGTGRTASVEPGAGRGQTSRQAPPPSGRDRRAASAGRPARRLIRVPAFERSARTSRRRGLTGEPWVHRVLNSPRPALVESGFDGSPREVNRQPVMLVREEWRVVDRWWTDVP